MKNEDAMRTVRAETNLNSRVWIATNLRKDNSFKDNMHALPWCKLSTLLTKNLKEVVQFKCFFFSYFSH